MRITFVGQAWPFLSDSWEFPGNLRAMSRRIRRAVLAGVVLVVVVIGGAFAAFALRGGDAPPPPTLSNGEAAATATADASATAYAVAPGGFVGYRVREEFAGFGVKDAVGRTPDVSGTAEVEDDAITAADLEADLTTLTSDDGRRDNALRDRGLESASFPTAEFELTEPVDLVRERTTARGRLTLHGETNPIRVRLSSQRVGKQIELVGSAPIEFADFGIEPPSVAGFVTVEDQGTLEFKLRLAPR
jgi:polyisoprenoid-binding protein YceI